MTLREAGIDLFDCEHKTPPAGSQGIPYITIPQMRGGHLDPSDARLVAPSDVAEWNRRVAPQPGDVIVSRRTNPGVAAVVPPDFPCVLGQNLVILRSRGTSVDQEFLRWLVRGPEWWQQIDVNLNVGAVFNSLRCSDIPDFELTIPPISEQRAIAHILGTLDDKIELNRRMSETLEAMARGLFKSWFVDFEPVLANVEGEDQGLPEELAELFPRTMAPSDLGEIPEGWATQTFAGVVEQLRDNEQPLESPDVLFDHFSIPAFDQGQAPVRESGSNIKSQKTRVPPGVVLLSKLNPDIERVWLVDVQPGERPVCSTEFLVLRPRKPFGRAFVYCLCRFRGFRRELEALVTGTSKSHQRARPTAVLGLRVIAPSRDVVREFERIASPLLVRALLARRELSTLAGLRDALLPKLVSGELRIEDAHAALDLVQG